MARAGALGVLAIVLVAVVAHRPLLVGFARLFRVDEPAHADALVVLTGGEADRVRRAAELYRRGFAPLVLIGSDADTPRAIRELVDAGVPAGAIRDLGAVASTHDEAVRVRDYARSNPLRSLTVVTTAYHTARARWVFRRVLRGTGVRVRLAAAEDDRFNESNWYRTPHGRLVYSWEFLKTIYYRLSY